MYGVSERSHAVSRRASGASPNPDDSEATSRLTGTADKTRRLPESRQSPRLLLTLSLQLPAKSEKTLLQNKRAELTKRQ